MIALHKLFTLMFVKNPDNNQILLGKKRRGFGEGKYNGYGGKLNENESIIEGAIRELKEESNLDANKENFIYLGHFIRNDANCCTKNIVHILIVKDIKGNPTETEEMTPKWFPVESLPYEEMWPDCKYWLQFVLKQFYFKAQFFYNDDVLIDKNIMIYDKPQILL